MLKIRVLETPKHRRLVIEGKLIPPWTSELASVWREATERLNGRELVVDVKWLTAINEGRENVLSELMKEAATFRSSGVFTKHVVKALAYQIPRNVRKGKL
jgi:hypothetical protein